MIWDLKASGRKWMQGTGGMAFNLRPATWGVNVMDPDALGRASADWAAIRRKDPRRNGGS